MAARPWLDMRPQLFTYLLFGLSLLIVFLLGVSLGMHNFWAVPADQYQSQLGNFSKNMAIAGGLLFVVAFGPGPWSLDALRRRKSR